MSIRSWLRSLKVPPTQAVRTRRPTGLLVECLEDRLCPSSNWTQLLPSSGPPVARYGQTAVEDQAHDRMIVFGGATSSVGSAADVNDVWVLSNADGLGGTPTWTQLSPTGPAPSGRETASAVYDSINNRLIMFGGNTAGGFNFAAANDVWVLSNADGLGGIPAWTQLAPAGTAPSPRRWASAAYDQADNRMIVFGGDNSGSPANNEVWVLQNANGLGGTPTWTQLAPSGGLPGPRSFQSGAYDQTDNRLIVFGGIGPNPTAGDPALGDTWVLANADGVGGPTTWSQLNPTGPGPGTVFAHDAVYQPTTNQMIVFGGESTNQLGITNQVWTLANANGVSGSPAWTLLNPTGGPPSARAYASAVFNSATDSMTVFAGQGSSGPLNDTWVLAFNPSAATLSSITVSPAAPNFNVGQTQPFTATGTFSDGSSQVLTGDNLTWSSSDPSVATIDATGLATADGPGTTTITASDDGISGSTVVHSYLLTPPTPTEGISTGRIAVLTFTNESSGSPGDGTIFWGDGATSLASTADNTITPNDDGTYTAWGSHTYAEEATGLTFGVAGNDGGHPDHPSFSATIDVADAPLALVTLAPPSPVQGTAIGSVVLATFTDANPAALATDFSATIAWGDQSTSSASGNAGTITKNADGSFSVMGDHTYAAAATGLTFRVDIADLGGAATGQSSTFDVLPATTTLQVNVQRVHITYGTALSNDQLTGTAKTSPSHQLVPGAFSYTTAAGIVLGAGADQTEQVTFTPTTPYAPVQATVTIDVARATPQVSVNPVNIIYGTALDNALLSGSASFIVNGQTVSVAGTFAFTRAAGKVLAGGAHTRSVTFTPTDLTDYKPVSGRVIVNVAKAMPQATANSINITYGARPDGIHLSGTASYVVNGQMVDVTGSFTLSDPGDILPVGQHAVSVTFTPANSTDYQACTTSMTVTVSQATPKVSLDPVNITYGTALNDAQLSGTTSWLVNGSQVTVDGTLSYTSDSGSILSGGKHTESITFTPTDYVDYQAVTTHVTVTVVKAMPTVTVNAVNFIYGTALKNNQLSGTATYTVNGQAVSVNGTFRFTSAAGTVLGAGANQIEQVTFTPNNSTDFMSVQTTVIVNVAKQPGT